jgi:hypothetical protein
MHISHAQFCQLKVNIPMRKVLAAIVEVCMVDSDVGVGLEYFLKLFSELTVPVGSQADPCLKLHPLFLSSPQHSPPPQIKL